MQLSVLVDCKLVSYYCCFKVSHNIYLQNKYKTFLNSKQPNFVKYLFYCDEYMKRGKLPDYYFIPNTNTTLANCKKCYVLETYIYYSNLFTHLIFFSLLSII